MHVTWIALLLVFAILVVTLKVSSTKEPDGSAKLGLFPKVSLVRDVFVVHGRNDGAKEAVARFLSKLDLNPIILHEQPNSGHTIIEKFEAHANTPYAVVLMTADDVASPVAELGVREYRARQNVVLEMGFFMAKLNRKNIVVLKDATVTVPSDISGVVFIDYDPGEGWKMKLGKELKSAGLQVDLNKVS